MVMSCNDSTITGVVELFELLQHQCGYYDRTLIGHSQRRVECAPTKRRRGLGLTKLAIGLALFVAQLRRPDQTGQAI